MTDGAERSVGIGGNSPAPPPVPPPPGTLTGGTSGATRCANAPVGTKADTETKSAATGSSQQPRLIEQSEILGTSTSRAGPAPIETGYLGASTITICRPSRRGSDSTLAIGSRSPFTRCSTSMPSC